MKQHIPYIQVARRNIFESPDWSDFVKGLAPMPGEPYGYRPIVNFLYYLGYFDQAREVSYRYSLHYEKIAKQQRDPLLSIYGINSLFESALYRSLAQRHGEARILWEQLVEKQRMFSDKEVLAARCAHHWIYGAYGLTKLGRYVEVAEPANRGFDGLNKGKGYSKAPHKNTREFGLVNVMIALAKHNMETTPESLQKVQNAFILYKKENFRYGKNGYDVIFDLQISYPDVFIPVLPGQDPSLD